jgi:hypothetical protein
MKADRELVHFHNALWASALSGVSGTALFWWWDQLDRMNHYHHFRPLALFLSDIPFTTAGLRRAGATVSDARLRAIGLEGRDRGYYWIFDTRAAWASHGLRGEKPAEVRDADLRIEGLEPGRYRVEWWDTRGGTSTRGEALTRPAAGAARLRIPPFTGDLACKIIQQ